MSNLAWRLWNSPTITTWASFTVRTLSLVIVLPLVLRFFSPAETALWQVFMVLISLQMLADLGFNGVFTRLVAYAMGGATELGTNRQAVGKDAAPNWAMVGRLVGTMRCIYGRLAWGLGGLLAVGGTVALLNRVEALGVSAQPEAWLAWLLVLVTTVLGFRANACVALLQGVNQVALLRRWETLFGLGSIVSSVVVLALEGGFFALVAANQAWVAFAAWRNWQLARRSLAGQMAAFPGATMDREVWAAAWGPAWRAGVGIVMSFGAVQLSSLIYAQGADATAIATYLLALRLMQAISQISQAPFYSKLPILARLWAQDNAPEMVRLAGRGMAVAYWAFVGPVVFLGFAGPGLLAAIGSQIPFPDARLWSLLGLAMLAERYGAMHLQLYSTTNHIVWHIANGVSGAIFLSLAAVAYPALGVLAFPVGLLAANLGFYGWYSATHSHRTFRLAWPIFDLRTAGGPALCLMIYLIYAR